jgi:hypothetical protein
VLLQSEAQFPLLWVDGRDFLVSATKPLHSRLTIFPVLPSQRNSSCTTYLLKEVKLDFNSPLQVDPIPKRPINMDKAKAAVSEFVGRSGKHDTTVDERQNRAVQHEEVQPVRHENITTAVDREVHQDHYHTTVQPIKDREVLPEKHSHQMAGVQHKEFEHSNPSEVKARLDREAQQFKDTSTTRNTQHTQAVAPSVEGERVHHHGS